MTDPSNADEDLGRRLEVSAQNTKQVVQVTPAILVFLSDESLSLSHGFPGS